MCGEREFVKTHSEHVVEGCKEIISKNAAVIVAAFTGEPPLPETTYDRTVKACGTLMAIPERAPVGSVGIVDNMH